MIKIKKGSNALFIVFIIFVSLLFRFYLLDFQSGDYTSFLNPWQNYIETHGGFKALKDNFSDYNAPYLYLLSIFSYFPLSNLYTVKFISIIFDLVAATFVFFIVKNRYNRESLSIFSFASILLAPTVIINGSYWGQCDIIYTSFLVASIYYLIKNKSFLSCVFFGIAFSFKLHSVFLFPFFVIMFLKKKIPLKHILIIPATYLLLLVPSVIAGRPWVDLLLIYWRQTKNYTSLTLNAPTIYQWLPQNKPELFGIIGLFFAAIITILFIYLISRSKKELKAEHIIKFSFTILIMLPFLLPRMHERYFFPADIFSIIYAFYFPKYFYIPIAMQIISLFSYQPFLFGKTPNFALLSLSVFIILTIVIIDLIYCIYFKETETRNTFKKEGVDKPAVNFFPLWYNKINVIFWSHEKK